MNANVFIMRWNLHAIPKTRVVKRNKINLELGIQATQIYQTLHALLMSFRTSKTNNFAFAFDFDRIIEMIREGGDRHKITVAILFKLRIFLFARSLERWSSKSATLPWV